MKKEISRMQRRTKYVLLSLIVLAIVLGSIVYFAFLKPKSEPIEKEVFRSTEWFPTATEALNWSLNVAPEKVESFSFFIYCDYGVTVTRHEIIVQPTEKYSFGYDVILVFYGVENEGSSS